MSRLGPWLKIGLLIWAAFTAISLAGAKYPSASLLLSFGGGLLSAVIGGICADWFWSATGGPPQQQRVSFSPQKGGPVAFHYERGNAFMSSGDIRQAIESFSKALRLNPTFVDALVGRGVALYRNDDYQNAIADLTEALDLDPRNARAYYYRGCVYGRQGHYRSAVADFDQSLRVHPGQEKVRAARELAAARLRQ